MKSSLSTFQISLLLSSLKGSPMSFLEHSSNLLNFAISVIRLKWIKNKQNTRLKDFYLLLSSANQVHYPVLCWPTSANHIAQDRTVLSFKDWREQSMRSSVYSFFPDIMYFDRRTTARIAGGRKMAVSQISLT